MIRNTINGKRYIGQSKDIKWRWMHHRCDLNAQCHPNKHLQGAWNKYGAEAFEFLIIEQTSPEELNERERFWITYYDSVNTGYNFDYGGNGVYGYKHSKDEIDRMRRIQSPNIVLQFDKDCKFIKEWIGGAVHAGKELGYTKECISLRCDHRIKRMSPYKDSFWVYKEEYENPDFSWDKYFDNVKIIDVSKPKVREVKRICQYTIDRDLVKVWDSLRDIRAAGFNTSPISTVLHFGRGKRTSQGFIWAFEGYDFSDGYFDCLIKYKNNAIEKRKHKVKQIDCDSLKEVAVFDSLKEAAKSVGLMGTGGISISTKFPYQKKSGGFYWISA